MTKIIDPHTQIIVAMTAHEGIMTKFYETLLHLRYPGIAQVTSKDIENTVLGSENRLFLLSWLLTQCPDVPPEEFSGKPDEEKLVKWYTNMGICINSDSLLGRVSMQQQLPTLRNLLLYMKNILITEKPAPNKLLPVMDILKKHIGKPINIIPPNCSLSSKLNYNEAVQYLKGRRKSLSEKRHSAAETPVAMPECESLSSEVFGSQGHSPGSNQEADREGAVKKFVEAFESASTWPSLSDGSVSQQSHSMDAQINDLHSNMTILKETMNAKEEVSKFVIGESLRKHEMPLDKIIEDVVIRIEEFSNLTND